MFTKKRRLKRFLVSASGPLSFAFLAVCISALGLKRTTFICWVLLGLCAGVLFLIVQTYFEFRRRTYDPTWALKYQDIWDESVHLRSKAAKILLEHCDKLSQIGEDDNDSLLCPIDDVLDILEDIGFYMQGDQLSPEVAHHHFYHWIRGYWFSGEEYIQAWQRIEPARWQHLKNLFDETSAIESSIDKGAKEKPVLSKEDIKKFLRSEMAEDDYSSSSMSVEEISIEIVIRNGAHAV